jgi:hypothetical protein
METALLKDDLYLRQVFETISKSDNFKEYIQKIALLVVDNQLTRGSVQKLLTQFNIDGVKSVKNDLLDLLFAYVNAILEDNIITDKEKRNFSFLKLYFGIEEGDFYNYKLVELKAVLHKQFEKLYADNSISQEEAVYNVNLQEMFDLSYGQFDKLKEDDIKKALNKGANILNLDTANVKLAREIKNTYK